MLVYFTARIVLVCLPRGIMLGLMSNQKTVGILSSKAFIFLVHARTCTHIELSPGVQDWYRLALIPSGDRYMKYVYGRSLWNGRKSPLSCIFANPTGCHHRKKLNNPYSMRYRLLADVGSDGEQVERFQRYALETLSINARRKIHGWYVDQGPTSRMPSLPGSP